MNYITRDLTGLVLKTQQNQKLCNYRTQHTPRQMNHKKRKKPTGVLLYLKRRINRITSILWKHIPPAHEPHTTIDILLEISQNGQTRSWTFGQGKLIVYILILCDCFRLMELLVTRKGSNCVLTHVGDISDVLEV